MSSRALSDAMTQVSNEAEYQRESERKQRAFQERREEIFGRARSVFVFLLMATLMVFGFHYRVEIQQIVSGEPSGALQAHASEGLKGTQEQATKPDAVLSEITQ